MRSLGVSMKKEGMTAEDRTMDKVFVHKISEQESVKDFESSIVETRDGVLRRSRGRKPTNFNDYKLYWQL